MKIPFFIIKILKFLKIYNFLKKLYKKYTPYSGIVKYDIESLLFEIFLNQINRPLFIDIGANKGAKIDCAINANKNTKIIAIEPFDNYFRFLKKKYINRNKVKLLNIAIDRKKKKKNFYYNKIKKDSEAFSLKKNKNLNLYKKINTNTLDNILGMQKADLIKIDVEGSEVEVLLGGKKTLMKHSTFFVEVTDKTFKRVMKIFKKINYEIFIYEYSIFKKNIKNLWKKNNIIQNNLFEKKIFLPRVFDNLNNKFMFNILAVHKSKVKSLNKIKIVDSLKY